ncbi:ABC transporter ATP-binding protein [Prochlorococcus sp. MIT 0601]|uniref:ABC transporter ATP-binding protein n=1 Tax=Prochlorococcus sp. MIT 0601 TaxID=1499498 RepID=UPI000563520F|nr:ABC transporter ATP-binding protein [Prochlorococcus sp. MIT 0601]
MTSFPGDVLNIKNLRMCYPASNQWILDGFNLNIAVGERVALIGSSGSGKSSVAKSLLQILPNGSLCKGDLVLCGKDLLTLSDKEMQNFRGEKVGFVFQDPMNRLNPLMTIGDHLIDTLKAHKPDKTSLWHRHRSEELLVKVGIDVARFNSFPHEFSGGMRQRLAIALAISLNPPLIVADEPTSSLDVSVANQIMTELSNLCDELGTALLLITHDLALAARWCGRMSIIQHGKIVEEGLSTDVVANPISLIGKRLVFAAREREQNNCVTRTNQHCVLDVDQVRCWHANGGLPWQPNWIKAVNEVSFSLYAGETLGVVGLSGCGKSTLCSALLGLTPIRGGCIKLCGQDLTTLNSQSLRKARQSLQMVFQDPCASMNPKMTVLDAIADPLLIHNMFNRHQAKEKARILLGQVGLTPVEDFHARFPNQLSGGQQQRVAIARALALNPQVLICDESVSMLDVEIQAEILALLSSLQETLGLSILFITHDLSLARGFCHRTLLLDQGIVVEEGPSEKLFQRPQHALTKQLIKDSPTLR